MGNGKESEENSVRSEHDKEIMYHLITSNFFPFDRPWNLLDYLSIVSNWLPIMTL